MRVTSQYQEACLDFAVVEMAKAKTAVEALRHTRQSPHREFWRNRAMACGEACNQWSLQADFYARREAGFLR